MKVAEPRSPVQRRHRLLDEIPGRRRLLDEISSMSKTYTAREHAMDAGCMSPKTTQIPSNTK